MNDTKYTDLPMVWRTMMKVNGISARETAMSLGINLAHFYNVLNGKSSPTLVYAQKVETAICKLIEERNLRRAASIGGSNATGGDTQQRIDGELPPEGPPPSKW